MSVLGVILVVAAIFVVSIVLPVPGWVGAMARYGFGLWLIVLTLLFYFAYCYKKRWVVAALTALYCALSLSGLWVNKSNDLQVLSGFVFFSDAAQYYADALRVTAGYSMSAFSGRHPLSTVFFAILLWLTNGNLQIVLALLAMIVSLCVVALGDTLSQRLGPVAAAALTVLLLLFYRRFTGLLNSEHLGFAFGCLSLAFLLFAADDKNAMAGLSGLLFLGIAIAARPGAFLILFFALIWVTRNISLFPNRWSASFSIGILAVSTGFLLVLLCNSPLAEKGAVAFSNYSYSLYGMVYGGQGWEQFAMDHPDALSLPSSQAESIALHEALQAVKASPLLGLRRWSSSLLGYFTLGPESLYGFVSNGETASLGRLEPAHLHRVYIPLRLTLYALTVIGVWSLWYNRRSLPHSILFWSGVATLVGISFVPAGDAGMMRIHAASMPYLLCLPVMGFVSPFPKHPETDERFPVQTAHNLLAYGPLVFILAGIPSFALFTQRQNFSTLDSQCGVEQVSVIVRMDHGSHLKVVDDDRMISPAHPIVHHSEFLEKVNGFYRTGLLNGLVDVPPGTVLTFFLDLRTGQSGWLILPLPEYPAPGSLVEVCGRWHPDLLARGLGFLQAEQVHLIRSGKR
jgi:hypothetical protein